ncbi:hypothetical protein [Erythrobacter aureus]|uniref:hypothetical protein n=1 Tax=Erythrobacter aureus TaxID=2182384 RepID=UPI0013B372F7|nr:hypothetical protein [Erythrobacter aureus]
MALPQYLLDNPTTNPTDVVRKQIENMGLEAEITRTGSTVTVRNLEIDPSDSSLAHRAIKLLVNHADANTLCIDAIVLPVQGNIISHYEAAGFIIHAEAANDDEGAHTLLRRSARR